MIIKQTNYNACDGVKLTGTVQILAFLKNKLIRPGIFYFICLVDVIGMLEIPAEFCNLDTSVLGAIVMWDRLFSFYCFVAI